MMALEHVYRGLWHATWPFIQWYVKRKDWRRHVPLTATAERFGFSKRPAAWVSQHGAFVLWIHGASVGECLSALPIVDMALSWASAPTQVVMTTTTAAARQLLQQRLAQHPLQDRVTCVFAPLDCPQCVERFYDEWRPAAGLWIESELWPTLILEAGRRKIRIGVVNGRISPQSVRLWRLPGLKSFTQHFMAQFSLVLCQDVANQTRFQSLGARQPQVATNLKFVLPFKTGDTSLVRSLYQSLATRSAWMAVSTHEGEETILANVHSALVDRLPGNSREEEQPALLTVIVPRHPERADGIVREIQKQFPSLRLARRSVEGLPTSSTDVFIVDSLGETASFFEAIPTVVIGGSFVPRGGHNPIEPLRAGCQVLVGPHMFNFTDILSHLQGYIGQSLVQVESVEKLTDQLVERLSQARGPSQETSTAMQQLATTTLTAYQAELSQWLFR
ncbi:hypothetical protein Poli38472_010264 [Pythium oligandrum]|uniref:3-deoxy-D-manno-octulosonic-acid transferase N-terminal domain-containing protein n=1 Tax=Pythium oligandrum TaxID=41045 RepID=A0A8K1C914_PYTOL|nr:hypothetical protein Poli38472_010264 [Pythium oligandrum]|eukprot:TMW58705.1 hypothetical protein Poli38472_010264 [Pythium oligandrum]